MIKTLIIENLGCILGEVVPLDDDEKTAVPNAVKIRFPMQLDPAETGKMVCAVNPMFRDHLIVNPTYIIGECPVIKELGEDYKRYVSQKQSGLILPPKMKLE